MAQELPVEHLFLDTAQAESEAISSHTMADEPVPSEWLVWVAEATGEVVLQGRGFPPLAMPPGMAREQAIEIELELVQAGFRDAGSDIREAVSTVADAAADRSMTGAGTERQITDDSDPALENRPPFAASVPR
jgi:hypothetical protein